MVAPIFQHAEPIEQLCHQYGVATLEVFGSAAREDFDPSQSDVDLIVTFQPGRDLGPWLSHFFGLRDDLQSLLQRPVDLVMASALRNPHFVREVNRSRKVLYAAHDAETA
jgi:predicted nucleotidyltransferase